MSTGNEKILQYLDEARATEEALVRTLQAHVAITPRGDYRDLLERHLRETEGHRDRIDERLQDLGQSRGVVEAGVGAVQSLVGQVLAVSRAPLDLVRGESGEEKLLKNAKDESATEALEIATYRSLEALAEHVGDRKTGQLAERIRREEERMLESLQELIPTLTEAVARAEVVERSYDASTTGAADAAREAASRGRQTVQDTQQRIIQAGRDAIDRLADVARDAVNQLLEAAQRGEDTVEATARAAQASVQEVARQADQTVRQTAEAAREGAEETAEAAREGAEETADVAREGAQETAEDLREGAQQTAAEARESARATAAEAREAAQETAAQTREDADEVQRAGTGSRGSSSGDGRQPWAGYDDQSVAEINRRLSDANQGLAQRVRDYERQHKNRSTVVRTADRKAR